MSEQSAYPFLSRWMAGAKANHPLSRMIDADAKTDDSQSGSRAALAAYDTIIETLEVASPLRLDGERAEFRRADTDDALLIVRAELAAGAKLARSGVIFEYGQRGGPPQPDLILSARDLAIEVKTRRLDGFENLNEELESALAEINAPVVVQVLFDERPLILKPADRARVVEWTIERVQRRERGIAEMSVQQPWAARHRLLIAVQIIEPEAPPTGRRLITHTGGTLSGHFQDLETAVLEILNDGQKIRQAEAMPTILMVEASRSGLAWMRPQRTWATRLAEQLPGTTPFRGVGVMISSLDSPDVSLSIGVRRDVSPSDASAIHRLAKDLGLSGP
ncbi:hypothetical protein [Streptomyces aureoverticillatus]|uniref:hypothetical protein n=1 Tax=Streptomyces aureoverticillatus TaxID=66871 RepID=UPI0013D9D578|nr:hypothetical protein [Streptomyces aureoverticillatus]QIB44870.1 hypothetical protein G3H79_19095 [Streptomyces aureoverticillatus]